MPRQLNRRPVVIGCAARQRVKEATWASSPPSGSSSTAASPSAPSRSPTSGRSCPGWPTTTGAAPRRCIWNARAGTFTLTSSVGEPRMAEPTPLGDLLVSDRYWLGRARGMLDQSIRGRDEAAARLTSGVGWLWTIYTGAALVGVALGKQSLPSWVVGLLVAPALLLVAAYALATWASLPVEVAFDPRVIEEIRDVHVHASGVKQQRLWWAGAAAGLGALAVVAAVVATATVRAGPSGSSLAAVVNRQPDGRRVVLVEGRVAPGAPVTVTVSADRSGRPVARLLVADEAGEFHAGIPINSVGQGYQVQAAWPDRQRRWTVTIPATEPVP